MKCFEGGYILMARGSISDITDKQMEEMADSIERYMDDYDRYIIKEGVSKEDYKSAKKNVRKLVKKLRKHDRTVFRDD